jgi:hypothetical protein
MPDAGHLLRTSDAERDRAVERLRDHAGAGRLDVEELEQRVGGALTARTHGELDALLSELPRPRPRQRRHSRRSRRARFWRGCWRFAGLPVLRLK